MMRSLTFVCMTALLAGCIGGERYEGVTLGAGNAIAANTAMQMVDPWQRGVEDTDLVVPAERAPSAGADADASVSDDSSADK